MAFLTLYVYLNTRIFPTTGYARVLSFVFIRRELGGTGTGCLFQFTYCDSRKREISNSYTMGCPPVRRDNPRALASGLSYVQVDNPWYNYFIPPTSVETLHITSYFVLKLVRVV